MENDLYQQLDEIAKNCIGKLVIIEDKAYITKVGETDCADCPYAKVTEKSICVSKFIDACIADTELSRVHIELITELRVTDPTLYLCNVVKLEPLS